MSRLEHLFVSHYADSRLPLSFTDAKGSAITNLLVNAVLQLCQ